ncbi:MAG: lysophospholipase [Deltaproteobacteria bacterium]|nr:lysophospholipase [Deltaproteobacteria bacterium]
MNQDADRVRDDGFFEAPDGTRLFWRSVVPAEVKARIVLVHGYSDHSGRYPHVIEAFADRGFAVHAFDYRGHGKSEGRRGHVGRFGEFVSDLSTFVARVRAEITDSAPLFVVAHSHGGLITLRWLLDRPSGLTGAVLTCPFLALGFEPPALKVLAARVIGKIIPHLPLGNELEAENLTRDEAFQEETRNDPLYGHTTTPSWFTQMQQVQEEVKRRASEIVTPLLILQAEADTIVSPEASRKLFDALSVRDKEWESYEGMRHEIYREIGREAPIERTLAWLEKRLG